MSYLSLFSRVWLSATPWTAACWASLSFTISQSLLKLMSIESVMPTSHLMLSHPLFLLPSIFSSIKIFFKNWLLASGSQSVGASASAIVLPMIIQSWFPLGLTGLISLLFKGLSRVFSSTTIQKHKFNFQDNIGFAWAPTSHLQLPASSYLFVWFSLESSVGIF